MTLSTGEQIENPRYYRESQSKIKRVQRQLSKKEKGSVRYKKNRLRLTRLHEKVANQRNWFLHNESINLIRNYDKIGIEDLSVSSMLQNRKLSKSISDASFTEFFRLLEYKSSWYGKDLVKVDRYYPSSQVCSSCGNVKKSLKLGDRSYDCESCGLIIDRDYNASINIEMTALGVSSAQRTQSGSKT